MAKWVSDNIGTVGVGLGHCHVCSSSSVCYLCSSTLHIKVPGTGSPDHALSDDELELGMGIHNEPGFTRLRPLPTSVRLVAKMLALITSTTDSERSFLPFRNDGTDEVVLMVNNLGGLSELELGSIAADATSWLELEGKMKVAKTLVGTFMVSTPLMPSPLSNIQGLGRHP